MQFLTVTDFILKQHENFPGYLARAPGPRVALGPPALLTIGDYDQRLFARAQLSKNIFSLWGRSFISVSISYCFV